MSERTNKNQLLEKNVQGFQTAKNPLKLRFLMLRLLDFVNSHI